MHLTECKLYLIVITDQLESLKYTFSAIVRLVALWSKTLVFDEILSKYNDNVTARTVLTVHSVIVLSNS